MTEQKKRRRVKDMTPAEREAYIAERKAKRKESAKRWREKNPDRVRAQKKNWNAANRDKNRQYFKKWYDANRQDLNAKRTQERREQKAGDGE